MIGAFTIFTGFFRTYQLDFQHVLQYADAAHKVSQTVLWRRNWVDSNGVFQR